MSSPTATVPATGSADGRTNRGKAAAAWLGLLCDTVDGTARGAVLLPAAGPGPDGDPWEVAAHWPATPGDLDRLVTVAGAAADKGRSVVRPHPKASDADAADVHDIAHPIMVGDEIVAVVAIEVAGCQEPRLPGVIRQVQSDTSSLALVLRAQPGGETGRGGGAIESALWLIATCLEHDRFRGAAMAMATDLATQTDCERVGIGFVDGLQVKVQALSHSADFGERMNLIRKVGAAMDEALDQRITITLPPAPDQRSFGSSAHEALVKESGSAAVCTVLMAWNDEVIGAITFERSLAQPFTAAEIETLEDTAALLGPILELKRRDDRWLWQKAWDTGLVQIRRLIGPGHVGLKAATIAAVTVLAFLAITRGTFRVTAPGTLEGLVRRATVAPLDGYIAEAPVRAGAVVAEGDVLAVLDDRTLRLEQQNWQSQYDQLESEYLDAMAQQERLQMSLLRAGMDQAQVRLSLVEEQLSRMRLLAPIDGVVVSGDLTQSIGAPVEQGEVLFEVAPLDSYRLMLRVDERDVAYVAPQQRGHLVLSAVPGDTQEFTIDTVVPVSTSEEGTNYFLVEASLDSAPQLLRPGMEGVGKIDIERRSRLWILTRRAQAWLSLWVWSWRGPGL